MIAAAGACTAEHGTAKRRAGRRWRFALSALALLVSLPGFAEPFAGPDDLLLRHDLQLLNDSGATNLPLTSWPLSWGDVSRGLAAVDPADLTLAGQAAYRRVMDELDWQSSDDLHFELTGALAENPRRIRGFEDTPREDAEAGAALSWVGQRLALRLEGTVVSDPSDDDELRADGSYIGIALGNWMLSAGWQDRWWGPGRDGSLILSTNARPAPGIAFQRNASTPFETKWLSWIGPWTLAGFLTELDDDRIVDDTRVFGMRAVFRPLDSLEIGLSRTAQWCGQDRPCGWSAFADLLVGDDNRGVNVDPEDEPGNQLAGIDMRWRLPRGIPLALYMQWIGEDTRRGGPEIGNWLRQAGVEHWGSVAGWQHRTHFEISDTQCRQGGFGFSDPKANCGYEHSIYRSGYRFHGRSMGHGADGDSLAWSAGSTLVQPEGHLWNLSVRYIEINRAGPATPHPISTTPQDITDILLTHDRFMAIGRLRIGIGYVRTDGDLADASNDIEAFVGWSTH